MQNEIKGTNVIDRLNDAGLFDEFVKAVAELDEVEIRSLLGKLSVTDEEIDWWLLHLSHYSERLKIDDPNGFVPLDKHDHERANRAVAAGYPAVEPVLWYLLEWIQDCNWPVAETLSPFLASIGKPLVPHIKKIFETDDEVWKYWIMNKIFLESTDVAEEFRDELERIAYKPNENEITEGIVDDARNVLKHYGWIEPRH